MPRLDGIHKIASYKNYAQNAEFRLFQRQIVGTLTLRADDVYGPDRWYALVSGGTGVQFARVQDSTAGVETLQYCQIRQADVTARQFGIAQILERERVMSLRGKEVTFSFLARTNGVEVSAIRAGLIEWTGSPDVVTSDVVSAWAATPTLVASAAFANTSDSTALSDDWARVTVTATLGTSFTNLVLFIWTPNTEAQNDDLYIKEVQLVSSSHALPWSSVGIDLDRDERECKWFYTKSYNRETAPGSSTSVGAFRINIVDCDPAGTTASVFPVPFKEPMRLTPTVTVYNVQTGVANSAQYESGANAVVPTLSEQSQGGFSVTVERDPSDNDRGAYIHWAADAEM